MPRKILIAMPVYAGVVEATTVISLLRAIEEGRSLGIPVTLAIRPGDSLLARARNALVAAFLSSDATELLFWDADLAVEPGGFSRFLTHSEEVVGGIYRARTDPEQYIFRTLGHLDVSTNGLIEVEGLGTGFLKLTRGAVERFMTSWPHHYVEERDGSRLPWLFDFERDGHVYRSEDFVFCQRFRAAGGQIWADPDIAFHHAGSKVFSGRFSDTLRRSAPADTAEDLDAATAALNAELVNLGFYG